MHLWYNNEMGWLEVIVGSMFSGKSEELIRRLRRAKIANQKVLVFKHSIDKRYHETNVVSHSKNEIEAISVATVADIREIIKENEDFDVLGVDETQFFGHEIVSLVQEMADKGKRVIVAGLDQDFRGVPFEPMPELMSLAEYVDKFSAICTVCGNPASKSQRLVNGKPAYYDDPVIIVGADESYEARCRNCHDVKFRKKDNELIFIVGTDTEVGKTYSTLKMLEMKNEEKVFALKPVETGLELFPNKKGSDSDKLAEKLGTDIDNINQYFFEKPLSPHLAAGLENKSIDIDEIVKKIRQKSSEYDILYVEGAGGLLVPYTANYTYLDLIAEFRHEAEVIVVAKNSLGTINHTLMTIDVLKRNGIKINGVIFNNKDNTQDDKLLENNIKTICEISGEKLLHKFDFEEE